MEPDGVAPVWGEYVHHEHLSRKNLLNSGLCLFALVPSYVAVGLIYSRCHVAEGAESYGTASDAICSGSLQYPLALSNALFFLNVTLGFWLIGLAQRSFWLIDPYWTILPPLLAHLYQLHPRADYNVARSVVSLVLIWAWAVRLTHSYFRREDWKFGEREDWRYTKMAKENPRCWPMLSFFAVGLAQQPMLIGITLPAYSIHFSTKPFDAIDALATAACIAGLCIAFVADNQLRRFMLTNEQLVAEGQPKVSLLETGLWRYSRHPNYFGEQLWWWSYALYAVNLGEWYMLAGTVFNSIILATVTVMTEARMLKGWTHERAEEYRRYQRVVSPCIPFFRLEWRAERAAPKGGVAAPFVTNSCSA